MDQGMKAAIARARSTKDGTASTLTRTYYGEEFELSFDQTFPAAAIEVIGRMQDMSASSNPSAQLSAAVEVLDLMATKDTQQLIADLMREGLIGMTQLIELLQAVIALASGRPFESSPSSDLELPQDGTSSTDGVEAVESTLVS